MKVELVGLCDNLKDRMAGWAVYRVSYTCKICGKEIKERVEGIFEEIKTAWSDSICEKCGIEIQEKEMK